MRFPDTPTFQGINAPSRIEVDLHDLEVEGEMRADGAVDGTVRERLFPSSRLKGKANLLVMPNLDAANIALNLLRHLGQGTSIGPILLGAAEPAHVLSPTLTVRGIINMTAIAVDEAQERHGQRTTRGRKPADHSGVE